jgi:hypothetical protein
MKRATTCAVSRWSRGLCGSCSVLALVAWGRSAAAADPTMADCLAASDGSIALRNEHKLRAARAQLLVCAAASCPADIRVECSRHVDEVNAAIPTIVFEAKDTFGNDISAVKVMMDGQPLAERLEGTAISLDPGEHSFTFQAFGQPTIQKQFVILEGQKDRREMVTFGAGAPAAASAALAAADGSPSAPERGKESAAQRISGLVVAGIGVAGLGIGALFGFQAMSKRDDATRVCPNLCASQEGVNLWHDAKTAGTVSTVAFVIGGLALAGGAALWFTAPRPSSQNPSPNALARRESGSPGIELRLGLGLGAVHMSGAW